MTKTCSECFKQYEEDFDKKKPYTGDFCSEAHEKQWKRDRGIVETSAGSAGALA